MSNSSSINAQNMVGMHALDLARSPEKQQPGSRNEAAGRAFESYFGEMLVREMEKTLPDGFIANDSMEVLSSLIQRALGEAITSGKGLGVGSMLSSQLSQDQSSNAEYSRMKPFGEPVRGTLTSPFGPRRDPFSGEWRDHHGVDIGAPTGTPIYPVAAGTVRHIGADSGHGNYLIVDHGKGLSSLYAHCEHLDVVPGQAVTRTVQIASVGNTGRSTGPHLHFEIHRDGVPINPADLLDAETRLTSNDSSSSDGNAP